MVEKFSGCHKKKNLQNKENRSVFKLLFIFETESQYVILTNLELTV